MGQREIGDHETISAVLHERLAAGRQRPDLIGGRDGQLAKPDFVLLRLEEHGSAELNGSIFLCGLGLDVEGPGPVGRLGGHLSDCRNTDRSRSLDDSSAGLRDQGMVNSIACRAKAEASPIVVRTENQSDKALR